MRRYAMLLDNGHVVQIFKSDDEEARAIVRNWNARRRESIAAGEIVYGRLAVAFIKVKQPGASQMGKKGGEARARKLSPRRRQEIARTAANKRWGK